jgi:hypothetical protein
MPEQLSAHEQLLATLDGVYAINPTYQGYTQWLTDPVPNDPGAYRQRLDALPTLGGKPLNDVRVRENLSPDVVLKPDGYMLSSSRLLNYGSGRTTRTLWIGRDSQAQPSTVTEARGLPSHPATEADMQETFDELSTGRHIDRRTKVTQRDGEAVFRTQGATRARIGRLAMRIFGGNGSA